MLTHTFESACNVGQKQSDIHLGLKNPHNNEIIPSV